MGDGLLAEVPGAVEAARCAVEIQHTMRGRNADVPEAGAPDRGPAQGGVARVIAGLPSQAEEARI